MQTYMPMMYWSWFTKLQQTTWIDSYVFLIVIQLEHLFSKTVSYFCVVEGSVASARGIYLQMLIQPFRHGTVQIQFV